MFTLLNLVQPDTIEEAYNLLTEKRNNIILGGCAFLRMSSRRISTAVDLSRLNLNYVTEQNNYIEIGATATFRDLETNSILIQYCNGIVPQALSNIIGIQFRNIVMVGASVYSKYGFSDLLTALLALDTEVELYKAGRISLEEFLSNSYERDILTRIFIKKNNRKAAFHNLRNSASDYPILNVGVSSFNNQWKITVGARPQRATIAQKASERLSKVELSSENIEDIAAIASKEIIFGTNMRGTANYREAICKVLVKRAIMEVLQCK
jgi:CO/xanthine dehydrogenase FAD-binding subunit